MWRCCGRKIDTQFNFTLNLASRQSNHICDKDAIEIYAQRQLNKENKLDKETEMEKEKKELHFNSRFNRVWSHVHPDNTI